MERLVAVLSHDLLNVQVRKHFQNQKGNLVLYVEFFDVPPAKTTPAPADAPAASDEDAAAGEGTPDLPAWIAEIEGSTKISEFGVLEAFPNSSLGRTILYARFTDARTEDVGLTVHDVQGRELARIDGKLRDGAAMLVWDGSRYDGSGPRPGVYFARLQASETILSTKFEVP